MGAFTNDISDKELVSKIFKWIKKMWYTYKMEYDSVIKMNEILPFVITWMEPECIMLSEINQLEIDKYHDFTHTWNLKKNR